VPKTEYFSLRIEKKCCVLVCIQKMLRQTNGRDFREILGQRACKANNNYSQKRTKTDLKKHFFAKYRQVFNCFFGRIFGSVIRLRSSSWPTVLGLGTRDGSGARLVKVSCIFLVLTRTSQMTFWAPHLPQGWSPPCLPWS
jgi:hypothetical protein